MYPRTRNVLLPLLVLWRDWPERQDWYRDTFIPLVKEVGRDAGRDEEERELIHDAKKGLASSEWPCLGALIDEVDETYRELLDVYRARPELKRETGSMTSTPSASDARARKAELLEAEIAAANRVAAENRAMYERERASQRARLLADLDRELETRFLGAEAWLAASDHDRLITGEETRSAAVRWVTKWCGENLRRPDGEPFFPNPAQAAAIATVNRHALVGARAGSGKTATMVARSAFLVGHCGVAPGTILMLAFNTSAAEEMRDRLEKLLPNGQVPHVMTFHALAHRIVHPAENLLLDSSDTMRPLSAHVQDVINAFLQDAAAQAQVRDVMLAYFQKDWSRIVGRGDNLSAAEQLEYRRHLQDESIKGDFVKSYGEKVIANILFTSGISGDGREAESYYGYEHDVRWNGQNYKPDFSIYDETKKRRIVIEYFGMLGEPEYDQRSEEKRAFWSMREEVFLEYFPADVVRPGFEERVLADLRAAGAPLRKLTEEELWHRIKSRAIDRFTSAVTTLVGRARQRRWVGEDLRKAWARYGFEDPDLDRFIDLAAKVVNAYELSLVKHRREDFTGLLWRAIDGVRSGATSFGRGGHVDGDLRALRHIVVDEFQDFSLMFFDLLQAALGVSPDARVMAVGDDWQAINEFAGSTTEYFTTFEQRFQGAIRLSLTTNRRSAPTIVRLGNAIMAGQGAPADAQRTGEGFIREFKSDTFDPSPLEAQTFGEYDRTTPALLRLIQGHRAAGRTVAVLSRTRTGRWDVNVNGDEKPFSDFGRYGAYLLELMRVEDPHEVRFNTIHGFKGQESDAVILLDVTERKYPLIHPTWTLFQVFGDTIQTLTEAERRLFYVGVSRPHGHLDVVTTNRNPSDFWVNARGMSDVIAMGWESLPQARLGPTAETVEVRVFNSVVKDFDANRSELKADHFRFRGGLEKYWVRLIQDADFDETRLLQAPWAQHPGIRIEAWRDEKCILTHRRPGGRETWARF